MADSVEKVSWWTPRNFLCAVGAVFQERCGGPHRPRPSQPKTPAIDLSQQAEEIEDRIVIQAKFFERLTSDFFNRIGHNQTSYNSFRTAILLASSRALSGGAGLAVLGLAQRKRTAATACQAPRKRRRCSLKPSALFAITMPRRVASGASAGEFCLGEQAKRSK